MIKPVYIPPADPSLRRAALTKWSHDLQDYWAYQYAHDNHECELIRNTPERDLPLLVGITTTEKAQRYLEHKLKGTSRWLQN
jgi:hypothetical protein